MISAWHLLWIIPLSNLISMFAVGICGFGSKSESMSEACVCTLIGESNKGRMADALAHGGDEGRDKLR